MKEAGSVKQFYLVIEEGSPSCFNTKGVKGSELNKSSKMELLSCLQYVTLIAD